MKVKGHNIILLGYNFDLFGSLVIWFYCMSTLVGLFNAEVSLTITVSNYVEYKIYLHNNFKLENIFFTISVSSVG